MEYKQSMNVNFVEMPLQELISSMTGPVFVNDPFPRTTSVVEHYHILPYKEILFELLHRNWPAHSVRDENLEEQGTNSTLKRRKQITEASTPKQNEGAIKGTGANNNQISSTSKQKKNNRRKFEASRATSAEGPNDSTADVSGGRIALDSGVQVEMKKTQKSICSNTPQDGFPTTAPCVNPVKKNGALELQNIEVMEKSGGVTENNDDQVYYSLRSVQRVRREILHKERILHERSAQCDLDIQTILNERKMTPKVLSIIDRYKGPCSNMLEITNLSYTGNGSQAMSMERKTLREALQEHDICQELDEMCNESNWILPRYTIESSAADGKFCAIVNLKGPGFEISTTGGPRLTPCKARRSAAAKMIIEIYRKTEEEEEQDN
uniref:Uncharacterized protein n=1 Tax=Avena sativa TaxID=4498 RepID=A0ACD5ZZN4_AVESA